jgi:hypothetical protein
MKATDGRNMCGTEKPLTSCGSLSVPPNRNWRIAMAVIALVCAGCEERIETEYGGRTGPMQGPSVNGTAVLADMLANAGHNIISRTSISPGLNDSADVIIWFPDDFRVPDPKVVRWLEAWLSSGGGRTLVYVGRDFDAAVEYWRTVAPTAPPSQAAEVKLRRDEAEDEFTQARSSVLDGETCAWFTVKSLAKPRRVTTLAGPWSAGVDVKKADLRLYSTYQFDTGDEVLLSDGTDTLAARRQFYSPDSWGGAIPPNQLIVVSNGSFLLNLQLVNHEHRKLAAHLIDELPQSARVVFLESGPGGPTIRDAEPAPRPPNVLEVFAIWPLGAVLLHVAALGLVFCFARMPIFGVPRDPREVSLSDFGKHITAFGELLHLTRDRGYAQSRLDHYHQTVHGAANPGAKKTKRPASNLKR